ncbi:MAG: 2-C-methyl-D-erythritol 2,4-cyclodiphosphate synthase [Deltaproteobacteria bacterium]|nr:MAG: 2-C-methyl-D-erythritol 2,4-cyclodiphosphate synthase [Deltaproteobacteria bacterium]
MRIGHGFDVHRLVPDRPLVLGGVTIPYEYGLLGHSDADVLLHAVSDAILGALGLGDIGRYFPDTDPSYKGINSMLLLEHVVGLAKTRKYKIINLDTTIIAQRPKLAPFVSQMLTNLAKVCQVPSGCVNVKATTTEELGYTGRGEGISAHAVVLMETSKK